MSLKLGDGAGDGGKNHVFGSRRIDYISELLAFVFPLLSVCPVNVLHAKAAGVFLMGCQRVMKKMSKVKEPPPVA